jgi:hypothetical protein
MCFSSPQVFHEKKAWQAYLYRISLLFGALIIHSVYIPHENGRVSDSKIPDGSKVEKGFESIG